MQIKKFLFRKFGFIYGLIFSYWFNRDQKPFGLSVDTTYRCNLRCKHCYFRLQNYKDELSKDMYIDRLKKLKGIYLATWVGGEPLLRWDLIEEGKKLFPFNWIVTNGTIPLPYWNDVIFFISIDGPENIHNEIRGAKVYRTIKDNVIKHSGLNIYLAMVLNRINYGHIEEMIEEWKETGIKGMQFDFYTPLKENDPLWLNWSEKEKIIQKIRDLKKKYSSFILLSDKIIDLFDPKNIPAVTEDCLVKKGVICLNPLGEKKYPCVMAGADCSRCGCVVPYTFHAVFRNHDLETIKMLSNSFLIKNDR